MSPEDSNVNEDRASQSNLCCEEARVLLSRFGEAVRTAGELHREQFQAIVGGDAYATRFDILIHEASEQKLSAKYAYLAPSASARLLQQ